MHSSDTQVYIVCRASTTTYFNYDKNHLINNDISVTVCNMCKIAWIFGLNLRIKRRQTCINNVVKENNLNKILRCKYANTKHPEDPENKVSNFVVAFLTDLV